MAARCGGVLWVHDGTVQSPTPMTKLSLFLSGDVMLGRGIDQILRHPSQPQLYEPHADSALAYVHLAEEANGPIPRQVDPGYVWGDALAVLHDRKPAARIINLETAITRSSKPWPKGINYRMHPANVDCLTAAQIDCCVLANNHVLDWGQDGLLETLATLRSTGIRTVGAGQHAAEGPRRRCCRSPTAEECWSMVWLRRRAAFPATGLPLTAGPV